MNLIAMKPRWLMYTAACLIALNAVGCKSKSSGNKKPVDDTQYLQDQLGYSTTRSVYLMGQTNGSTVTVSSQSLATSGGLSITVSGISSSNLLVGLTQAPTGVVLQNQSGSYVLTGQLPSANPTSYDVVILARDTSICTGSDCSIMPDSNGKFSGVTPNSTYDAQGSFRIQLQTGGSNPGWSDQSGDQTAGGGWLSNLFGGSKTFQNISQGASNVWTYLKGLFNR